MIKVLHVFGRMDRGGAETRTVELMPLLKEKGVGFDYCTLMAGEGPLNERIEQIGGNVYPCPLKPGTLSFPKRFVKFLKQSDYDIVQTHVHYFSGYIAHLAAKAGIKHRIVHFRITDDGKALTLPRRLYRGAMHRLIDKNATSILAVCRGAMDYGWGKDWIKDDRCRVIYNGLDLSGYDDLGSDRQGVLQELDIPENSKLVINVARFQPQKAHNVLIESAAKVINANSDIHFLLVGIGELREKIESRAAELGINGQVHFLGLRSDVPRLLKASDCFVLSSDFEGLPGVVLESVAAKLPTIATDLPGVREISEHTDLIKIVPVGNRDAISQEVVNVFSGSPLGFNESPFPAEFDLRNCADNLYDVYKNQVNS